MPWMRTVIGDKRDGLLVGATLVAAFFFLFVLLAPADEVMFPQPRSVLFLLLALSVGIGLVTSAVSVYRFGVEYSSHSKMIADSVIGFYIIVTVVAALLIAFLLTSGIVERIAAGENPVVVIISGVLGGFLVLLIFYGPIFGIWYGYVSSLMIVGYLLGYGGLLGVSLVVKTVGS